jgi:hypothetical protein
MKVSSRKKTFPVIGTFALLMGLAFIARGAFTLGGEDPVRPWMQIILGIFLFVSWIGRIQNDVIQILVDDDEIRYRKRNERDLVVQRADLIDFEVLPSRINYRYKGPLDVQSAAIPLRRFNHEDVERLKKIFRNEEAQQDAT